MLCSCGCGQPVSTAKQDDPQRGYAKGQPVRFIRGHNLKAAHPPWWKGDEAGYGAIHAYLLKHYPKAGTCEECSRQVPTEFALIKGRQYTRIRSDYRELCKRCHNIYDGIGGSRWRGIETAAQRAAGTPEPRCACGCGEPAGWNPKKAGWRKFAPGHYAGTARRAAQGLDGPVRAPWPATPVSCANCRSEFTGARRDARFCSKACKAAARRAAGSDDITQACHQCGGDFTSNRYDRVRHCSQSCGAKCQPAGGCPSG